MKTELTLAEFDQKLQVLAAPITDFTPALKSARQIIIGATQEGFNQEKAPDGQPWAKLKRPRNCKRDRRRRRKGSDKILNDTSALRKSVTTRGAAGNIDQMTPTTLEWGTDILADGRPYGLFHQEGTGRWTAKRYYTDDVPGGGMVARPFLGLNDEMEGDIEDALASFIERKIGEVF